MSLSSICVVTNALRLNLVKLREVKPRRNKKAPQAVLDLRTLKKPEEPKNNMEIKQEETTMKKTMTIEGMMCVHCQARVKKALEATGVKADVSFETGLAILEGAEAVSDEQLKAALEAEGYTVVKIA